MRTCRYNGIINTGGRTRTANEMKGKTMRELTNMIIEHDQVTDKIDDLTCDIVETVSTFLSSVKRNVDDADIDDDSMIYAIMDKVDSDIFHLHNYIEKQLEQLSGYQSRRDYLAECIEDYGTDNPLM